jgi:HK97 family phage portal protein
MSLLEFTQRYTRRAVTHIGGGTADVRFVNSSDLGDERGPSVRRSVGFPPVSQALQMIAGDCAKMPAMVYEVTDLGRVAKRKHEVLDLIGLWGAPNETSTTFEVLFDWFFHALIWGRSAIYIERNGATPVSLLPLLPDRTAPVWFQGKRYFQTEVQGEGEARIVEWIPNDDVLYLEFFNVDGLHPEHPVRIFRSVFEQAINAADFTSKFFSNGSQQGGILMAPPGASETAIKNTETAVKARADKENWFRTLVLKDGFRWQSTTSSLRDATAVELDEATARHVARIYNIPPSKLGLKDTVSYNSLDQDNRQYLDSCLSSWLIQARSQFHRKLILPSKQRRYQVDYEIDALQWADAVTKAQIAEKGIAGGWLDLNIVRRWFNQDPVESEDTPDASDPPETPDNSDDSSNRPAGGVGDVSTMPDDVTIDAVPNVS